MNCLSHQYFEYRFANKGDNSDSGGGSSIRKKSIRKIRKTSLSHKRYYLDKELKMYITRRQAECMVHLINGKTIPATAKTLKLSPRTVEYYVNKMKRKLRCKTKADLIEKIIASGFLEKFK